MKHVDEVRAFVVRNFLFGDASLLTDDTSFLDSGIIDSTGMLELIMFLEERYGFKIPDEDMVPENLDSIHRIAGFLDRRLAPALVA